MMSIISCAASWTRPRERGRGLGVEITMIINAIFSLQRNG